jgi:predicted RND superfamily exporter protein
MLLICLRHFLLAFLIFITAVINEQLCGTLLYWTNAHVDSISMLISSLVYVLTISAGIHLVNYYRKAMSEGMVETAPVRMIQTGFLPCFLALATTILGFVSLMASKMIPIRTFGIYASLALFIGTVWLFIFLFALLNRFPVRQWNVPQTKQNRRKILFWKRWMNIVLRFHLPIAVVSLTAMFVFYFGVGHLKTTVSFHSMFPKTAKIITDYETLEDRFTGLIPVEVVLRIPEVGNESQTVMDQLYFVRELRNELSQSEGVEDAVSILSFLPNLPAQENHGANATARRRAMNLTFKQHPEVFKETGFFSQEPEAKKPAAYYWRLSLRTHSKYIDGYDNLLAKIRERIDVVKTSENAAAFQNLQFAVTGGVPLVHRAQAQLLTDLTNSFVSAFALIFLTMVVMLRGVVRGLLAMVPNIFPCVLVFGAMGFLGIPVDMGSMMTASVAMGIAVDGTLHFLTHFNHGLKQGMPRHVAVHFAYRHCATALLQSTLICCLGMLVFGFSGFMPVSRFAFLLNILLLASFIGDAVVFPAILFSPLGRFFEQKRKTV